jgi:hypothetical protein
MNIKYKIILLILFVAIIYLYSQNKSIKESMANTDEDLDEKIKSHVNKIYIADIKSIRNLANISTELQKGSLKIPGNLIIEGELTVNKNLTTNGNSIVKGTTTSNKIHCTDLHSNNSTTNGNSLVKGITTSKDINVTSNLNVNGNSKVKGQTTINQLYGGISGWGGWRTIKVNGNNLAFDVGANKYGFHSNTNGLHYARSNKYKQLSSYLNNSIKYNDTIELETNSSKCGRNMKNNSSCAAGISTKTGGSQYRRKLIITPDWSDIAKGWIIRKPTRS